MMIKPMTIDLSLNRSSVVRTIERKVKEYSFSQFAAQNITPKTIQVPDQMMNRATRNHSNQRTLTGYQRRIKTAFASP
jgi:hypothetical protein